MLLKPLVPRPGSRLAAKFACNIGEPSDLIPFMRLDGSKAPLQITDAILDLHRNAHTAVLVRQRLVSKRMADFDEFLHAFTDGTVHSRSVTAIAACQILDLRVSKAGRLPFSTFSTNSVLAPIRIALQHLFSLKEVYRVAIFSNSRCSLQLLKDKNSNFPFVREVFNMC